MLPIGYILTATPYMWLGILLGWILAIILGIFPISGAYSYALRPAFTWTFIKSVLWHWFLPFLSLFIVQFGGWAIGMRNMIIYELEADYAHYLEALGAPRRLIRRYAYNNAQLPQLSGLALKLGVIVAGAMATEIVFSYPGIGYLILMAIQNSDYFLLQGCFLFIIIGVLLANFIIDIVFHPGRSAHPPGYAGRCLMSEPKKKSEFLFFALRNGKLKVGLAIVFIFILIAIFGPLFSKYPLNDFVAGGPNPPSV